MITTHQTKEARTQKGNEPTMGMRHTEAWACLNNSKNPAVMGIDAKTREDWCTRISISVDGVYKAGAILDAKGSSADKVKVREAKEAVCKKLAEIINKTGEKKISKHEIESAVPDMLAAIESKVAEVAKIAQAKTGGIDVGKAPIKEILPPIMEALPVIAAAPANEASYGVTAETLLERFIRLTDKKEWALSRMNEKYKNIFNRLNPESLKVVDSVVFGKESKWRGQKDLNSGHPQLNIQKFSVVFDVVDELFVKTGLAVEREQFVKALNFIWERSERASDFWKNRYGPCHTAMMKITGAINRNPELVEFGADGKVVIKPG